MERHVLARLLAAQQSTTVNPCSVDNLSLRAAREAPGSHCSASRRLLFFVWLCLSFFFQNGLSGMLSATSAKPLLVTDAGSGATGPSGSSH